MAPTVPPAARPMMRDPLGGGERRWERRGTYAFAAAPAGAEVLAPAISYVEAVWNDAEFGLCVRLGHMDGSRSVFVRLGSVSVSPGASVGAGDVVARVGQHGAQGFGVEWHAWGPNRQPINPVEWLFKTNAGRVVVGGILAATVLGIFVLWPDTTPRET